MTNVVYLSRRNLLSLLSKLDRRELGEDTACALVKFQQPNPDLPFRQTMDEILVVAVSDHEFYGGQNRTPGDIHPADLQRIKVDLTLVDPAA